MRPSILSQHTNARRERHARSEPPSDRVDYPRGERIAAYLGLTLLIALQLVLARYWLDLIDEGYFADLADRVARGELPYRDFATPYTPGLHYLHAWAYGLFGRDLVTLRLVLTIAKSIMVVLLYVLARRLMPPGFAVVPILLLFGMDTVPIMWEPHPAWYALLLALAMVWSVTRLIESGDDRWAVLAGAMAGLSFAFKQNLGLFALVAAAGFLLFESGRLPAGRARLPLPGLLGARGPWTFGRLGFAALLCGVFTFLLWPYLEPRVGAVFLAPPLVLAAAGVGRLLGRPESRQERERAAGRLIWLGTAFLGVTLPWLTALLVAVGPASMPWGQLVGQLDLAGFYWELEEPRLGFWLLLFAALACPIAVQRIFARAPFFARLLEAAALLVLAALASDLALADTALAWPDPPEEAATVWDLSLRTVVPLVLYVPSLAFWGGLVAVSAHRRELGGARGLIAGWYLLAGALLLFNFYPRMDTMHVTFSGPLLFVVGAFALYRLYVALDRRLPASAGRPLYRLLLFGALMVVPVAAALPTIDWRVGTVVSRQGEELHFDPPEYVPIDVPGASVLVPASSRDAIGGVARFLRERTLPGEPIFVYPTLPMFYYLADRPNPTRFGHVYPAAATAAEQLEMIETLESRRVRYVVWDQFWVNEWGKPELNRPLTDYLLRTYRAETTIGPFYILARSE